MDLGSDNVRELDSVDAPIGPDEFKVAMKCGPTDFHFIRLTQGGWYNKSGDKLAGLYLDQSLVTSDIWYPAFIVGDTVFMGYISDDYPCYNYETIYFAVKVSWDEG